MNQPEVMMSRFSDHLDAVDETYFEHMGQAFSFGIPMIAAGLACLCHGLLPNLFATTGTRAIKGLYGRMVLNRRRVPLTGQYDYVI